MNNTQLYLSIGLPMLTIILTWLASRTELNRQVDRIERSIESLRSEMVTLRNDDHSEMVALRNDFHSELAALRSDHHSELSAFRNDHHKDMVSMMGYMVPLHERMTKIESHFSKE